MCDYEANLSLPEWYNITRDGQPSMLLFDIVMNITNYSSKTALIDYLSLCIGNRTTDFNSIFQQSSLNGTVEGLWLDGKWVNVTWVPSRDNVPAHLREGVDIARTFTNGTLSYVGMSINGSWTDVTGRVRLLEKDTVEPMSDAIVMTDLIARDEIRFFNPHNWQPSAEMGGYSVTNVDLTSGFSDRWSANQSRLIELKGILPLSTKHSGSTAKDVLERLNSNLTLVRIQASTKFEDSLLNGVYVNTNTMITILNTIQLKSQGVSRKYNSILRDNQVFQPDQFGVEVFIKARS